MIQVTGLTRRYGSVLAVSDLSFSIKEGEIVGFLGPNGAGKTTTMNMLTGCLRPSAGSILLGGFDIDTDAAEARKKIGYLPENPPLYPDMTVEEYLDFVYHLKQCKLPLQEQLQRVCTMAGLTDVQHRIIRNLSKGYRQRVGLAQALIGNPDILLLDEPTVGLDPKQMIEIRETIRRLGNHHTVILSSHILSEVQAICDRILVIHHGKLVADGTSAELSERMEGAKQLDMTIEGDPTAVLVTLRAVPGIAEAIVIEEDGKKSVYRITAEPDADVRHSVFDALSQNHMPILSMQQVQLSLEDIFLELTETESVQPESEPVKKKRRLFGRKRGEHQ